MSLKNILISLLLFLFPGQVILAQMVGPYKGIRNVSPMIMTTCDQ